MGGTAVPRFAGRGVPFRHLVIYVPKGRPYFCVEPVSHANGAIARSLLASGGTLAGEIVFRPFTL